MCCLRGLFGVLALLWWFGYCILCLCIVCLLCLCCGCFADLFCSVMCLAAVLVYD